MTCWVCFALCCQEWLTEMLVEVGADTSGVFGVDILRVVSFDMLGVFCVEFSGVVDRDVG